MKRLLAAHTALVYLFLYLPIAVLVVFSFNAGRQTAVWDGFTLDWYRRLAEDDRLLGSVRNSLLVAGTTTLIATVLGTMAALALARQAFRGRRSTEVTLFLPIILPEVILGAALLTFFGAVGLRLSLWTVVIAHVMFCVSSRSTTTWSRPSWPGSGPQPCPSTSTPCSRSA